MKMDSKEDNIKLAKFVCQLYKKREIIINAGRVKIKYTRLMSHNTAPIATILKIRLGLDS